jgi:hypothetical protein
LIRRLASRASVIASRVMRLASRSSRAYVRAASPASRKAWAARSATSACWNAVEVKFTLAGPLQPLIRPGIPRSCTAAPDSVPAMPSKVLPSEPTPPALPSGTVMPA